MPSLDERFKIIDEMFAGYMNNVPERRVKVYMKRLPPEKIDTERLRAAVARCVEHGGQRGVPTVAEILRAAADMGTRRSAFHEPADVIPLHPECKKVVHETPHGPLLCCRDEGHINSCEPWFDHAGPCPEDAEIIARLVGSGGKVVQLRQPDDLLEPIL